MKSVKELLSWKELPIGGIVDEGGTSSQYRTGDWRSQRPIWDENKCIQCLQCWIHCPDSAIIVKDEKMMGINYEYCKGCGICKSICPPKVQAITMKPEKEKEKE